MGIIGAQHEDVPIHLGRSPRPKVSQSVSEGVIAVCLDAGAVVTEIIHFVGAEGGVEVGGLEFSLENRGE